MYSIDSHPKIITLIIVVKCFENMALDKTQSNINLTTSVGSIDMKSKLTPTIIGCTLITILTSGILPAQSNDYGTSRQLRTCPSRTTPSSGRISVEQAKIYAACYYEEKPVFNAAVDFVDILSLQVAPKSRRAKGADFRLHKIDIEKPIYDIRGSIVVYNCQNITAGYPRGQNCRVSRVPNSTGKCYQTTFGDWYCTLGGASLVKPETKMRAPE
jgi:hypothetical protein